MFKFPADLKQVREASQKVIDFLADLKLTEAILFQIRLCFEEAFINAVKYGNKHDPLLTVDVDILRKPERVEIVVCDQGEGFDSQKYQDPTLEEHLTRTHGRGIYLIQKLMDEVFYTKHGSCIHMIKKIR